MFHISFSIYRINLQVNLQIKLKILVKYINILWIIFGFINAHSEQGHVKVLQQNYKRRKNKPLHLTAVIFDSQMM